MGGCRPFYPEFLRRRQPDDDGFECPQPITCQFPRCTCDQSVRRDFLYVGCERGHDWEHMGGMNAGCGDYCHCSVPVHRCKRCGAHDYGVNDDATTIRVQCAITQAR